MGKSWYACGRIKKTKSGCRRPRPAPHFPPSFCPHPPPRTEGATAEWAPNRPNRGSQSRPLPPSGPGKLPGWLPRGPAVSAASPASRPPDSRPRRAARSPGPGRSPAPGTAAAAAAGGPGPGRAHSCRGLRGCGGSARFGWARSGSSEPSPGSRGRRKQHLSSRTQRRGAARAGQEGRGVVRPAPFREGPLLLGQGAVLGRGYGGGGANGAGPSCEGGATAASWGPSPAPVCALERGAEWGQGLPH